MTTSASPGTPMRDPDAPPIRIAIDGPAASGKSSTAHWVAERLGFLHVDSGALYRAATASALARQPDDATWDDAFVLDAAGAVSLRVEGGAFVPLISGERADEAIRGAAVTARVSRVAQMRRVRDWVDDQVRAAARKYSVVVDGRDIGTVVLPDAELKVFLVADPWERARRRLSQQLGRRPSDVEIAEETDRLVQRDAKDATQTVQGKDAVLIDTTYITQEEQVERIVALALAVTHRGGATSPVDDVS